VGVGDDAQDDRPSSEPAVPVAQADGFRAMQASVAIGDRAKERRQAANR
jgi:hypothetical protein